MKLKAVSRMMLTLLFICILTLAFNIESQSGTWSSYDDEQTEVAATPPTFDSTTAEPRMWSSHGNEQSEVTTMSSASASGSAEVRFDPQTYTFIAERRIGVGYRFNATIELYDVTELFTWQVRVYFNNTVLNATNAYYHSDEPIHAVNNTTVIPWIENGYNETHGYVQHSISAEYPYYVNVTKEDYPLGLGICILEFEVLMKPSGGKTLESNLILNNPDTFLIWKDGSIEIPCTKKNGVYRLISATIRVPTDYSTIQEAINAANPGNTIFVYNGTYSENVIVNKTLMLVGQNAAITIINGSGGTVLRIDDVDYVTIDGFSLTSGDYGIVLFSSQNDKLSNCVISKNSHYGIFSNGRCSSLIVQGCNITENMMDGIYAHPGVSYYLDGWTVFDNNISGNYRYGIYAFASGQAGHTNSWYIYNNFISGNGGGGILGIVTKYAACNDWFIYSNYIITNGGDGIVVDQTQYPSYCSGFKVSLNYIAHNNGEGIYVDAGSDSWIISANRLEANNHGILTYSSSSIISENIVVSNEYGILLHGDNNVLRGNRMSNNTYNFGVSGSHVHDVDISNTVNEKPIYYWINIQNDQVPDDAGYITLVDSANITVRNINLSHNKEGMSLIRTENTTFGNISVTNNIYGIYAQESSNLTVFNNQVTNNTYGIYLQDCSNGTFSCNKAINNTYGVYFKSSVNCTVTGNNVEKNDYGIYLSGSSNNTVYHNNFDQNDQQVAIDGTIVNVWDNGYPSGGNYWSDYTGPDECKGIHQNETDSDGIVDSSYVIDQNNIDNYPLSAPWSLPINIIMPGNTTYRGTNITLTFTADLNASWIGYSLDGKANVTITGNVTLTNLSYGLHYIVICANDTSGNIHSSAKVYFTITFSTDLNYDRTVDGRDLAMVCYAKGSYPGDPRWKVVTDVNRDDQVDRNDIDLVAADYGKTWY